MKSENKTIFVTQPTMPPLEEYMELLSQIWETRILTNNGPFHKKLEKELAEYLGVKYISLFANGTLALVIAVQALQVTGEVITTPYSFVATTHSLWWNNIKPVFVDVDPIYGNLDPSKIEAAITPQTTAILPVHVYGNPCNVEEIDRITKKYNLKVIYDAAHTFGVKYKGNSLLVHGDLSVLSFHATKVFTTFEGGAIVCHDQKTKQHIDDLKNFGFRGETTVVAPGINGKMNELQAAMGLLQLRYIDSWIEKRRKNTLMYRELLNNIPGLRFMEDIPEVEHGYSYFPIFIEEKKFGMSRDDLYFKLRDNSIFGRRYFYPLISDFPTYRELPSAVVENLPVSQILADQVICLPIYPELCEEIIMQICDFLRNISENYK